MTWLLVEDDADIRNVVAVMMTVWGETPLPFPDGNAAWAWLDSVANGTYQGDLPELALMDIRMPGYTGDKIAARIRQTEAIKDIPVILMTAFSVTDTDIKRMMDNAGIDHLINKPLPDMDIFRDTLYRVRSERRSLLAARNTAPIPQVGSTDSAAAVGTEAAKVPEVVVQISPDIGTDAKTVTPPQPEIKAEVKPETNSNGNSEIKSESKPEKN